MPDAEIVVVFAAPAVALAKAAPAHGDFAASVESANQLDAVLAAAGAVLNPVFDLPAAPPAADGAVGGQASAAQFDDDRAEMARYFHALVPEAGAEALANELAQLPQVECAYLKPPTVNPLAPDIGGQMLAAGPAAPPATPGPIPDFRTRQAYLDQAPGGVGTAAAWSLPGGRGADVKIIDIEGGWYFGHVDLAGNLGLLGGTAINDVGWRNHGTAVFGEVVGNPNPFGVTGIAPEATIGAVSHNRLGSAKAIQLAAQQLRPGDVLLLEMHRPGPRANFQLRDDQIGYIPVEWWPDDFLAIRAACNSGIVVVEAAGNGGENLDDPVYSIPHRSFPPNWRNPFAAGVDSGAILVGAGAPPSGNHGPDRSRLGFSNYGSRLDCQGWGREVTSTGYGNLYAGSSEAEWFTHSFSGTSSASPIVTGVVACLQGIAKQRGRLVAPMQMRALLRASGSPQLAGPGAPTKQRIGNRPDLAQIVNSV